jgi:hypothetical protein
VEILPFIWFTVVVIWEFYLEPALDPFLEPFIKTLHVHFVPLYVREVLFVQEEFAHAVEFSVVVPEFSSPLYSVLLVCVN